MNLSELGQRIDGKTACELVAFASCKSKPISRITLIRMEKDGRFPKRLKTPLSSPVYDTQEVLNALGLKKETA
jgi:hypothetical protein